MNNLGANQWLDQNALSRLSGADFNAYVQKLSTSLSNTTSQCHRLDEVVQNIYRGGNGKPNSDGIKAEDQLKAIIQETRASFTKPVLDLSHEWNRRFGIREFPLAGQNPIDFTFIQDTASDLEGLVSRLT